MEQPYLCTDIPEDHDLSEYFAFRRMNNHVLPDVPHENMVDVIAHRIKGYQNPYLVLEFGYMAAAWFGQPDELLKRKGILHKKPVLRRLYEEKSKWNDFVAMSRRLKIVLYPPGYQDALLTIEETAKYQPKFASWLNSLQPTIITDGYAGSRLRSIYSDCTFINFEPACLSRPGQLTHPHLGVLKNHNPRKDFLCLMSEQTETRNFRNELNRHFHENDLVKDMIYSFKPMGADTYDDVFKEFPKVLNKDDYLNDGEEADLTWPLTIPPVSSYNQTNFEIVSEAIVNDNDDTFDMSEKNTKPMVMRHPFMVLANMKHLENLRRLGFRTFHDHIDESYDLEPKMSKRIEIIIENMKRIRGNTLKIYNDTKDIREHNFLMVQHHMGMAKTRTWQKYNELFNKPKKEDDNG